MGDDDPRNRYANIKQEYKQTSQNGQDEQDQQEGQTGQDGQHRQSSPASDTDGNEQDGQDSQEDTDRDVRSGRSGSIKQKRPMVQAYIPAREKDELDTAFRQIKALCNLADRDEPMKNDFYAAALRHGYTNLAAVAEYLGLAEPFEEYGDLVT